MMSRVPIPHCGCFSISRRSVLGGLVAAIVARPALAQNLITFNLNASCSFYPNEKPAASLYSFDSSEEATSAVKRITNAVGLEANFKLLQANVPNATAVIEEQQRLILYSLVFIQQVTKATASEWAAWAILAHEIGHHLNGHTLLGHGSRPPLELQADRFAGHAVRRMGGTLDQALSAYRSLSEEATETHPPKSARLEAVTRGWTDAIQTAFGGANPTGASNTDPALREIVEAIRTGRRPSQKMTPALSASLNEETLRRWTRSMDLGGLREIKKQGQHAGADGNTYALYSILLDNGKLSCVTGTSPEGLLTMLYFN
jgi:hypothetical protein